MIDEKERKRLVKGEDLRTAENWRGSLPSYDIVAMHLGSISTLMYPSACDTVTLGHANWIIGTVNFSDKGEVWGSMQSPRYIYLNDIQVSVTTIFFCAGCCRWVIRMHYSVFVEEPQLGCHVMCLI